MVKGAIVKGVGQRLRVNSSKTEYFLESVEETAKCFKISGYNYQNTKRELMKFKDVDPIALIRKDKVQRNKPDKGVKAFYVTKYDPRMPHPRQLISTIISPKMVYYKELSPHYEPPCTQGFVP